MIVKNAKFRLLQMIPKYNKLNRSPTMEELHIFSVLTTTLFFYDPIGIQNALDLNFSIEDIYDEYDLEAATLLCCRPQWPDTPCLGHAIKEVLDHFFDNNYPWEDCLYLAEQVMPSILNTRVPLNLDAIKNYMVQRKHKWILINVE